MLFYIALDFDAEMKVATESADKEKTYELPDVNIITVGNESDHEQRSKRTKMKSNLTRRDRSAAARSRRRRKQDEERLDL